MEIFSGCRWRIFRLRSLLTIGIVIFIVLLLITLTILSVIRPPRTNTNLLLFPGFLYQRIVIS